MMDYLESTRIFPCIIICLLKLKYLFVNVNLVIVNLLSGSINFKVKH